MSREPPIVIECRRCGQVHSFDQPYPYHAGFADQGFLYNDAGNLTLVRSCFHPACEAVVGRWNPWCLTANQQQSLEARLLSAPVGGSFRFGNPARCIHCGSPISGPVTDSIHYLVYPNSLVAGHGPGNMELGRYLTERRE
jgi:hypothetical protein